MARVEVSAAAAEDVARLRVTHSLPSDTNERIRHSIRPLGRFPRFGAALEAGGWEGFRFVLGPWRWMVIVYEYETEDIVMIVTVQDARSTSAATSFR